MRIFGGHDYYDGAAAAWPDEAVWNRIPQRLEDKDIPNLLPQPIQYMPIDPVKNGRLNHEQCQKWLQRHRIGHIVVIFCGKIYRGVKIADWHRNEHIFWTREELNAWLASAGLHCGKPYHYDQSRDPFLRQELPAHILKEHIKAKITVLAGCNDYQQGEGQRWLTKDHDKLTEFGFQQILNATAAAQELLEWQGNILTAPDPAKVTITDDKIKAAKHGFDKWSFRKMPAAK